MPLQPSAELSLATRRPKLRHIPACRAFSAWLVTAKVSKKRMRLRAFPPHAKNFFEPSKKSSLLGVFVAPKKEGSSQVERNHFLATVRLQFGRYFREKKR